MKTSILPTARTANEIAEFGYKISNVQSALFLGPVARLVHGLDPRQAKRVISTPDDVVLKAIMANQISTVMQHLYKMTFFRDAGTGGARRTRSMRPPDHYPGRNAEGS